MCAAGRGARLGASRLAASAKFVLVPAGDCSTEHIAVEVPEPVPIPLEVGLYELGRAEPAGEAAALSPSRRCLATAAAAPDSTRWPADIIIPFPTVSGRHAMLRVGETEVVVTDLQSTNGTYVDGEPLPAMKGVSEEALSPLLALPPALQPLADAESAPYAGAGDSWGDGGLWRRVLGSVPARGAGGRVSRSEAPLFIEVYWPGGHTVCRPSERECMAITLALLKGTPPPRW